MAKWKLEAAKMAMYLSFPVASFYFFNQPQLFEEYVIKMKRVMYPPENEADREAIRELKELIASRRDDGFKNALLEYERREKENAFE